MTVQEAITKFNTRGLFSKKNEKAAQAMVKPEEEVLWAADANVQLGVAGSPLENGTVVITNKRVFFANNVSMGMFKNERQILLKDILQVSFSVNTIAYLSIRSLIDGIQIEGIEKKLVIAKEILEGLIDEGQKRMDTPEPEKRKGTNAEELLQWKNLLDAGAITQAEYDAKKKQLLGL